MTESIEKGKGTEGGMDKKSFYKTVILQDFEVVNTEEVEEERIIELTE